MTLKQTKESNDCHATAMFQGGIEIGKLNLSFKKFVSTLNCNVNLLQRFRRPKTMFIFPWRGIFQGGQ